MSDEPLDLRQCSVGSTHSEHEWTDTERDRFEPTGYRTTQYWCEGRVRYLEAAPTDYTVLCIDCGCLVGEQDWHDTWHAAHDSVARAAAAGERADSMTRRIG